MTCHGLKLKHRMQVLQQLPRAWRLMLLTFSSAVSVYQLGHTGLVTADVISDGWQPATASMRRGQQPQADMPIRSPEPLHVASLQSCQEMAEQVIASWRYVPWCETLHSCSDWSVLLWVELQARHTVMHLCCVRSDALYQMQAFSC